MTPLSPERQALVVKHRGLVLHIARRYFRGHVPEDVISAGYVGLVEAAHRWDESKGGFTTIAFQWVFCRVLDYIMRDRNLVRFGTVRAEKDVFFNLARAQRRLGDDPERLAAHFGVSEDRYREIVGRLHGGELSLDAGVYRGSVSEEPFALKDAIPDAAPLVEETVAEKSEAADVKRRIRLALWKLDRREQVLIRGRYLEGSKTLQEVGDELGVCRERARQLEERALRKLKLILKGAA
jgi:RNA polymerase sigma-32 factor